mmetsp:Transcript_57207/g.123780  ORF Transcript_57207/g.123780 Transcript_57207/m.123780 type:complete len:300 (+) Transcript_57207:63-962(+)
MRFYLLLPVPALCWSPFPSQQGVLWIHEDCIHRFKGHFSVETSALGDTVAHSGGREQLQPCAHEVRRANSTREAALHYYSDWAAYAQSTRPAGYGHMSSDWVVPAAPKSTGPIPGMSSAYLFNGLEDSGGEVGTASYILQPVLSYGKSGCIVDPLQFFQWHLTSFHVTKSGRAYCGARLHVEEGELVRGTMHLGEDGKTWQVEATRLKSNESSTYSVQLTRKADAAYVTLETMINYGCDAFPASGSVTFSRNDLRDTSGGKVSPEWQKKILHTECGQRVELGSDGLVTIAWDANTTLLV